MVADAGPQGSEVLGRCVRLARGPRRLVCDYTSPGREIGGESTDCAWWFGYWQRREYTDVLAPALAAALGRCGDQRCSDKVIGVHVRRGDMLVQRSATPAAWFREAVQRLRASLEDVWTHAHIRVWSDDPEWCEEALDLGSPFEVVQSGSPIQDLAGLSRCGALVISRSTFSWWAARLAADRGVLTAFPAPWWPGYPHQEAVIPSSWLPIRVSSIA